MIDGCLNGDYTDLGMTAYSILPIMNDIMEIWLIITVVAAFLQNARSLLQKRLTGVLSVNGAAYVRFVFALPFAWAYAWWCWGGEFDHTNLPFWYYVSMGAVAQILATAALVGAVAKGNFAVGTAYSKTEAAQAAFFSLVVLTEGVSLSVVVGIAISLCGVVALSGNVGLRQLLRLDRTALLGLAAGTGFALSAVGFRGASLALDSGDYIQRAAMTVMVSVTLQTLLMGAYLFAREPGEMKRVLGQWRIAIWVGLIGAVASAGWFTAMTLKNAAVVRAVGQVELLFTVLTSVWFLGERLKLRELVGIALVVGGILLLVL